MNRNLLAALGAAAAGIPVFPMRVFKDGSGKWKKKPAIKDWRKKATTDAKIVERWAKELPQAVFAIELEKAGLVAIDCDRHREDADGCAAFKQLVDAHGGDFSQFPMTLTSGGGWHFFFQQPEVPIGCPVRTALPPGIDIKGVGGNIVVPGSFRPDGEQWRPVDDNGRPSLAHAYRSGLAVIPAWIEQLARKVEPREQQSQQGAESKFPRDASDERGHAYAKAALDRLSREIADMPDNSGRNNAVNAGAFNLGRMVARRWIGASEVNVALFDAAARCGLVRDDGADAVRATIASGLGAGLEQPHRDLGRETNGGDQKNSKGAGQGPRSLINAQELCGQQFPDVRWIIPGLIPEGVTLLASRPKLGKSWLVLQIAAAVAKGVVTLTASDEPPVGDVLYAALEDTRRRLQRRLTKYFGSLRETWPARLTLATEWPRLDQGGIDRLREWCLSVSKPALIVIDVLKKVRPPKKNGQTDYDADYMACEGLHGLAADFGIGIIVVTHDRKMGADDVFDTVSGTLGLTGAVDTIAILKRNTQGVTLHVEGRDLVDRIEKAVVFDRDTCRWTIVGEATEVLRSAQRSRVLRALAKTPDGLSTQEIIGAAELRNRSAADTLLSRMAEDGEIERLKLGRYGLPGTRLSLSTKRDRQKDRQNPKPLESEGDELLSVDLSSSFEQRKTDLNGHEHHRVPPSESDSNARPDQSTTDVMRSIGATLDLDIPTFLKRGNPECIFGSLDEKEVLRSESGHPSKPLPESGPVVPKTPGVPFMITHRMRLELAKLGYTSDEIANMIPAQAHRLLSAEGVDGPALERLKR
jgi:hypothetical protein